MKRKILRLAFIVIGSLAIMVAAAVAQAIYPLVEEFDSNAGFTSTDPEIYIQDGKVQWTIHNYEGYQYVYRSIPEFSGDVRITVTGQTNWAENNCDIRAGIGDGLGPTENVGIMFGWTGGGCPTHGYFIGAQGVELDYISDGCSFTPDGALWVSGGTEYTATLTITDTVLLEVPGVGSLTGTPIYNGVYDTLVVGFPGPGDWPSCGGSIEKIIVEPLLSSYEIPDGKIAFQSNRDGNWEIYVMNSDGSDQRRLTSNPGVDSGAAWSPDGSKIVFVRDTRLRVMSAEYGDTVEHPSVLLTEDWNAGMADWSADGNLISYSTGGGNHEALHIIPSSGGSSFQCTDNCGSKAWPVWSPVASQIALGSTGGVCTNDWRQIYLSIIEVDGNTCSEPVFLLDESGNRIRGGTNNLKWSPDGTKLLFLEQIDSPTCCSQALKIYDLLTKEITTVYTVSPPSSGIYVGGWSPDGSMVLFSEFLNSILETSICWIDSSFVGEPICIIDNYFSGNAVGDFWPLPNLPPTANANGPYLGAVGSPITFDGTGSADPDGDPLTYSWNFGDSSPLGDGPTPHYTYTDALIYDVCLTVDDSYESDTECTIAVVYDPSGGFVTGGGWIHTPGGAYVPDPLLTGKAVFGFVSKYKKGANTPTGETEFQFKVADLNFHSTSYEWLVVNQGGSNAQFKGSGSINGSGNYKFMLWAGDDDPDTFRIKIWEDVGGSEVVIYDNGASQAIAGGSIVVHTKK